MKILVAITTGRPAFRLVLDMVVDNIRRFDHIGEHQFGVVINYDPYFQGLSQDHFKYTDHSGVFREVIHIGPNDVPSYHRLIRKSGINDQEANVLVQSSGYGNKKNLILLEGLLRGYELILFLDDDEYPVACLGTENNIEWVHTDVISAHLSPPTAKAQVTFGFWTGYISPIPPNLLTLLPLEAASLMGSALEPISDVVTSTSFLRPGQHFYLAPAVPEPKALPFERGGKWISGGNLAIRCASVTSGAVPPFYTPVDSRGDDTILSTGLRDVSVYTVPSGIFHDCFFDYLSIPNGELPMYIQPASYDPNRYTARFVSALRGWIAYAPLLAKLRYGHGYEEVIHNSIQVLQQADAILQSSQAPLFLSLGKTSLSQLLSHYASSADSQYREYQMAKSSWRRVCAAVS